jgi:hypothetical protein
MLDRDTLAALVPSGFENQAASAALHTRAKTVDFGAAAVVRLKGSLRHRSTLLAKP